MLKEIDFMHLSIRLANGTAKVKQYPYRSAMPKNFMIQLPRDEKLEDVLERYSGARRDNHTLYEITCEDGSGFVIFCSDRFMTIGCGVLEQSW